MFEWIKWQFQKRTLKSQLVEAYEARLDDEEVVFQLQPKQVEYLASLDQVSDPLTDGIEEEREHGSAV